MSPVQDEPVTVKTVPTDIEAAIIVAALADHGINARKVGDFTAGFRAEAPGSVAIVVKAVDEQRARDVLANITHQRSDESRQPLSHFDEIGASRMVDVSDKPVTRRIARASGIVRMQNHTQQLVLNRQLSKGDVLEVARLAGIMAAKRTGELIPLCHPLPLESITVDFSAVEQDALRITATVEVTAKTGVEMEALTAVSVAALTIYDMCKSVDRSIRIESIQLEEKSGGRSGHYVRKADADS